MSQPVRRASRIVADVKTLAVYAWFPTGSLPTGEVRRISPPVGHYLEPSIHPDGTHAAYWGGGIGSAGVWRTNLATFRTERITSMASGSWQPSYGAGPGDEVVFASDRFGEGRAEDMDELIERIERTEKGGDSRLRQSDGGEFGAGGGDLQSHIFLASADGKRWRGLTSGPYRDERPALSPGSDRVAFVSDRPGAAGRSGLWLAPTAEDAHEDPSPLVTDITASSPTWSPDGASVYFAATIDGVSRLCVVPVDAADEGGAWRPLDILSEEGSHLDHPTVTPDGETLLAHSVDGEAPALVAVTLEGGAVRPIQAPGFDVALHASRSRDGVVIFSAPGD
jgi:Tol biopolymer transport system component